MLTTRIAAVRCVHQVLVASGLTSERPPTSQGGANSLPPVMPLVQRHTGPKGASNRVGAGRRGFQTAAGAVLGVATAVFLVPQHASAQRFQALGDLPGGTFNSAALGISADGTTVVGYSSSGANVQAFRWRETQSPMMLPLAGATESVAFKCSADGSFVAGYINQGSGMPARWNAFGIPTALGRLPGDGNGFVQAITDDGTVAVGFSNQGTLTQYNALYWIAPGPVIQLADLSGGADIATGRAVTKVGSTIVIAGQGTTGLGNVFTATNVACRWVSSSGYAPEPLGYLPGGSQFGDSYGISRDGQVIVGASGSNLSGTNREAFMWTEGGGMIRVGSGDFAGGLVDAAAHSVSDLVCNDRVIVGYGTTVSGRHAFVYDSCRGMRDLNTLLPSLGLDIQGWTLQEAWSVSADGTRIAGFGINPSGDTEGWVVTLPRIEFQQQPVSQTVCCKGPAGFEVVVDSCSATHTFQWQAFDTVSNNWVDLVDGEAQCIPCGVVVGATTRRVVIAPLPDGIIDFSCFVNPLHVTGRRFRCVVTSDCGSATSAEATLTICLADFNCDGMVSSQDFFDYIAAFFGSGCP